MSVQKTYLPINYQMKFDELNNADKEIVLKCKNIEEAKAFIDSKNINVNFVGSTSSKYKPLIGESGSSRKYKNKKLFTEEFEESDVRHFMDLVDASNYMEDEIIEGELNRYIDKMHRYDRQPLQCLVYATKYNEKIFYNNEKKVNIWAKVIADTVNNGPSKYIISMNHMLVNWKIWKYQVILLIKSCSYIQKNETLDEVIRDLYVDYDDDKVRFTVMKRMLYGLNRDNYICAFNMLKKTDFINSDVDRKYFNALKYKIENARREEYHALYETFRGIQGFSGAKKNKIERLFDVASIENDLVKAINESSPKDKDKILDMVKSKIYDRNRYEYRNIAYQARYIKKYRTEIQAMFMEWLKRPNATCEDIQLGGQAIVYLSHDDIAVEFMREQMISCKSKAKKLIFAYILAKIDNVYMDSFIEKFLKYNEYNKNILSYVKKFQQNKNQIIRQCLYENCLKIKNINGTDSEEFETALRNIGIFLSNGVTMAIYDIKFDQMLFEYIGYDKLSRQIDQTKCTARKISIVIDILENIMDSTNYEGRYMRFMQSVYGYLKETHEALAKRINNLAREKNLPLNDIPEQSNAENISSEQN